MKTLLLMIAAVCLTACGGRGNPVPVLDEGALLAWVYQCDNGRITVEYAQMGGQYSATLHLPGEQQGARKVLPRVAEHDFALDALHWQSADGIVFALRDGEQNVLRNCRSSQEAEETGRIRFNLGKAFE